MSNVNTYKIVFNNKQRCIVIATSLDEAIFEAQRLKGFEALASGVKSAKCDISYKEAKAKLKGDTKVT